MFKKGSVKFKIHNTVHTVTSDVPVDTSLNTYIRNYANLKGTKYMCLEGGCGACIVAVQRTNPVTGEEETFAVNSCLISVFSCHGWNIITVQGIGSKRNGYHKVQKALAGFSGTQCGYCSPGMVMNMFSLLEGKGEVTMGEVENSFGGNICRCTGYRPILDAFKSLASDASPELKSKCADIEDIMTQWKICSKTEKPCNNTCKMMGTEPCGNSEYEITDTSISFQLHGAKWFRVKEIKEIYEIFNMVQENTIYRIVAGNTAQGVYRVNEKIEVFIDVNGVKELQNYTLNPDGLSLGGNMSLNKAMEVMNKVANEDPQKFSYLKQVASHIDKIANVPVRNVGTLAGNLSIKHSHREFSSDLFLLLETVKAQMTIGHKSKVLHCYSLESYLDMNMRGKVILNIMLPALESSSYIFNSYKIMQRAQNTHAYVNAGFLIKVDKTSKFKVISPSIVFGGINPNFIHAKNTEKYLKGKNLLDVNVLKKTCDTLKSELQPDDLPIEASPEYRVSLAVNLFYKFVLNLSPNSISSKYRSGGPLFTRPLSSGTQDFQSNKSIWPMNKPIPKVEAFSQCAGESEYIDDIPAQVNELYGAFVVAKKGPGKLISIDISPLTNIPGVVKFLSAKDIPGKNTFVEVYKQEDEELFAETEIKHAGQTIGVVIATSQTLANQAAEKVIINIEQTRKPILDIKHIVDSGETDRIFKHDEKSASEQKKDIKFKFNGSLLTRSQYHYTLETQTCYCIPVEDGMNMYPSTQFVTAVQHNAAVALNMPENSINISVKRLGGGFGGKETSSTIVSTACAVAAYCMQVPVRMVVKFETNMESIGKRFPMYAKYEVAVNEKGEVQYLNIKTYTDHGATLNNPLFNSHGGIVGSCPSCYDSSTWKIVQYDVKTDCPTNTYCRAPGGTEAIALIEHIMDHIASVTNLDPVEVRLANLNVASSSSLPSMIDDVKQNSDFVNRKKIIDTFNNENRWKKRGISLVTMNYPFHYFLSYHVQLLIYAFDGTVALSHGGIEMGQGLNTKAIQACAYTLGIDVTMIKIKPTNNLVAPNDSKTAACMASDGVTCATIECCKILLNRLEPIKKANPGKKWTDLIAAAYAANIDLCCEFMYSPATSNNHNYNILGATVSEVEVDLLTGQYQILRVDLLEDVGQSISPTVDLGQVEGAFIMGLGYWLTEKLVYDENTGALLTNRTWNYTPPGVKDIPIDFRVYFRRNAPNLAGVLRSKATGEPPICMSIGVVFAIRNALLSGRQDAGFKDNWFDLKLPYTPENVYLSSMTSMEQFAL